MAGARTPFTDDDDSYLVKYIGTYAPQSGRRGNALYQALVENKDKKWSWSQRHSWQSWRDRYVKRQGHFDPLIEHYLRQRAKKELLKQQFSDRSTVEPESVGPSSRAVYGRQVKVEREMRASTSKDVDKGEGTSKIKKRSSANTESRPEKADNPPSNSKLYPDIPTFKVPKRTSASTLPSQKVPGGLDSEPDAGNIPAALPNTAANADKPELPTPIVQVAQRQPKKKRKRRNDDDGDSGFFESDRSSNSTEKQQAQAPSKRAPLKRVEGAFRATLNGGASAQAWPPQRNSKRFSNPTESSATEGTQSKDAISSTEVSSLSQELSQIRPPKKRRTVLSDSEPSPPPASPSLAPSIATQQNPPLPLENHDGAGNVIAMDVDKDGDREKDEEEGEDRGDNHMSLSQELFGNPPSQAPQNTQLPQTPRLSPPAQVQPTQKRVLHRLSSTNPVPFEKSSPSNPFTSPPKKNVEMSEKARGKMNADHPPTPPVPPPAPDTGPQERPMLPPKTPRIDLRAVSTSGAKRSFSSSSLLPNKIKAPPRAKSPSAEQPSSTSSSSTTTTSKSTSSSAAEEDGIPQWRLRMLEDLAGAYNVGVDLAIGLWRNSEDLGRVENALRALGGMDVSVLLAATGKGSKRNSGVVFGSNARKQSEGVSRPASKSRRKSSRKPNGNGVNTDAPLAVLVRDPSRTEEPGLTEVKKRKSLPRSSNTPQDHQRQSRSSNTRRTSSQRFTPLALPSDEERRRLREEDYEPLPRTRASELRRLQSQGRGEEAIWREQRRASLSATGSPAAQSQEGRRERVERRRSVGAPSPRTSAPLPPPSVYASSPLRRHSTAGTVSLSRVKAEPATPSIRTPQPRPRSVRKAEREHHQHQLADDEFEYGLDEEVERVFYDAPVENLDPESDLVKENLRKVPPTVVFAKMGRFTRRMSMLGRAALEDGQDAMVY